VDLSTIPGLSAPTLQGLWSELGSTLASFPTAKHFVSWLSLFADKTLSAAAKSFPSAPVPPPHAGPLPRACRHHRKGSQTRPHPLRVPPHQAALRRHPSRPEQSAAAQKPSANFAPKPKASTSNSLNSNLPIDVSSGRTSPSGVPIFASSVTDPTSKMINRRSGLACRTRHSLPTETQRVLYFPP